MKNKVEQLRKAKGITQTQLAKDLCVSRQTIFSLETGRYDPSIALAHKVAKFFGTTIEEVFIFEEE